MRVAIDKRPLVSGHKVRGIGAHTRELISALNEKTKKLKDVKIDVVDFSKTDLSKYDIAHYQFFHPFFLSLPFSPESKRTVITIHDLIPLIYPKHYPAGFKGTLRFLIQKFLIKKVDGIITISETSKKDIVRFLGVHPDKIYVIYLAPKKVFKPITNHKSLITVRNKYKLPKNFALYVGDVNYNKNIPTLIKACKMSGLTLVICGKQALDIETEGVDITALKGPRDWMRFLLDKPHPELAHYSDLLIEFRKNPKVIRTGFIPDEDLVGIFNLATVYCQPSFYEGFGIPVLEAMACSVPCVVAKNNTSVEIADKAALLVDPKNPKDMAEKISDVAKDTSLRVKLIREGEKTVKKFSWKRTARETLEVYKAVFSDQ